MRNALILFAALLISGDVYASEESPMVFNKFKIESNGFSDSGPVVVSGKCGSRGVADMNIRAFGRDMALSREQLKGLSDINVNGMQISLDGGGYSGAGGRKIIIILLTGYYADVVNKKYVTVAEEGGVQVGSKL